MLEYIAAQVMQRLGMSCKNLDLLPHVTNPKKILSVPTGRSFTNSALILV
jgi:hypothetical protein